jgi:DNA polymerase I-like protein with 3'-5' exonuclease and polymerase domains
MMDFLYKLLNYYVQGSAADVTKEALIRWYNHPKRDPRCRFLVTVYDEINISVPLDVLVEQMELLREVMESIEMDVLMLSSPKVGRTWGHCKKPFEKDLDDGTKWVEPEEDFMQRMCEEMAA